MNRKAFFLLLLMLMALTGGTARAQIKILHGPYLQNMGEREVTLVWISDKPSVGWAELAPDDGTHFYAQERTRIYDTRIGIKNTARIHTLRLTGLKPHTRYRYRVCVQEVVSHQGNRVRYGDIASTDVYGREPLAFTTNDASKASVAFAMVNDIHGQADMLDKMLGQCDWTATDLVFFNGDMVSVSNSEEQMFSGFMDTAVKRFAGNVPLYYCRGNHETRGAMAPRFKDYFNPSSDELYYMFRQGPVCFIVLDCGEDKPDSDVEYYGITAYDDYRTRQARWLETALQSDLYRTAPFKVVVCHMPPFGGWHGELDIARKFIPLLNAARPDVYLTAHLHQYQRNEAGKEGVEFPLIVNANNTLLKAEADNHRLDIRIFDLDGRQTDRLLIEK